MQFNETPNPLTLKFMPHGFFTNSTGEFKEKKAASSDLVKEMLSISGVYSIFIGKNFISVTRKETAFWEDIRHDVIKIIDQYKDEISVNEEQLLNTISKNGDTEIEKNIIKLIDEKITPAVEADGGYIEFIGYNKDTQTVYIAMKGACATCPQSQVTLKYGIENTLKYFMPNFIKSVETVDGLSL